MRPSSMLDVDTSPSKMPFAPIKAASIPSARKVSSAVGPTKAAVRRRYTPPTRHSSQSSRASSRLNTESELVTMRRRNAGSIEAICSTVVPVPKKMVEPSSISSTERHAICNFSSACFVRFSLCEYSWRSIACGRLCALRAPPCTRSISPRLASSSRSRRIVISETPNASEISLTETVPCSSSSCRTLSCRSALITMSPRCSTLTSIQTITNKLYQTRARQK